MRRAALALFCCLRCGAPRIRPDRSAAEQPPVPTAKTDMIPPARDIAYPGTMQLTVDAST